MRVINTRFFFMLVATLVFMTAAVFVVHRLQASNISDALLFQAKQAENQGRLTEAARFLGRYLEFEKADNDQRAHLGKMLADPRLATTLRTRNRARFVLEQVLIREPQRHEARQLSCRLALENGDLEAAREQLSLLEKAPEGAAETLELTGAWQEKKGLPNDALASYRASIKLAPDRAATLVRLADLLRRLDAKKNALEIDNLTRSALRAAPQDADVLLLAAGQAQDNGNLKLSRSYVEKGLKEHPREGQLYQALARLNNQEGKRAEALTCLRGGIKTVATEQKFDLLWTLANLLLDGHELEPARQVMAEIREWTKAPAALEFLQARCWIEQGRWFEAVATMERIRPAFKAVPELAFQIDLYLGACYEQLENPGSQLTAFQRALEFDHNCLMARKGIAAAQWQLGRAGEAVAQYQALADNNAAPRNDAQRLINLARVLLIAQLQSEQPNWAQVESALAAAEKEQPLAPEVIILKAELAQARKQPDQADALLAQALKANPKQVELWAARIALAQRAGSRDKPRQLLEEATRAAGAGPELRLAALRYWLDQPQPEARAAVKNLATGLEAFSAEDQSRLLDALAIACQQIGDLPGAKTMLRAMTKLPMHAEDVNVRLMLFEVARLEGNDAAMQKLVAEMRTIEGPEGATWHYAEALRKLWLGRRGDKEALEEARNLLTAAASQRQAWHAIALARGEIDELQGREEQAIAHYRRALTLGSRNPRVTRQLVLLLTRSQRFEEAEQEIRRLQQQSGIHGDLQRLAVAISLNKKDFERAELLAKQTVAVDSNDYRDYLWMGQVLAAKGSASIDAEDALRRAVAFGEKMPETWIALVRYLSATGQAEAARAEIDKAKTLLPAGQAALTLAQCYQAAGQIAAARSQFQIALAAPDASTQTRRLAASFFLRAGQPLLAEPLLRSLLATSPQVSQEEKTWAQRTLILTLAATKDPRRVAEAMSLAGLDPTPNATAQAGEQPHDANTPLEDRLVRARLLALQNNPDLRRRAISILEDQQAQHHLEATDQLLLAQLYLAQNAGETGWRKCKELLNPLILQSSGPQVLTFAIGAALQFNDVAEAEQLIGRLEQLEKSRHLQPGEWGSIELKANVLEMAGRPNEAIALLEAHARAPKAPSERLLNLAAVQARCGHLKEAIDQCVQAAPATPLAFPQAAAILRNAVADGKKPADWDQQWARAESLLTKALADSPNDARLYLQMASLQEMNGDRAALERWCQKALERDPTNQDALNNLAWYLAQDRDRHADALALINRAVEIHGALPDLLDTRGVIYLAKNEPAKAIADLGQAASKAPTAVHYFHLTRAYHQANNRARALEALQKANALGLAPSRLSPSERAAYEQVLAELKQK